MDLSKLTLFAMMTKRLAWLSQRQQVLAQNIANADTPDYKPRDLKAMSFKDMARTHQGGLAPEVTRPGHISPARANRGAAFGDEVQKRPIETTLSGNAVVLEEQVMKAAETSMAYELTTNLYRKHVAMIKEALGRGS